MKHSVLRLDGNSIVSDNSAKFGGGLSLEGSASVTLAGRSSMHGNTASQSGGGLAAWDNSSVTLIGASSVQHNMAVGGGGLFAADQAVISCTGCFIAHNTAKLSEACALYQKLRSQSLVKELSQEDSLMMEHLKRENPDCWPNTSAGGGGLFVLSKASVTLAAGSSVHGNVVVHGSGGGLYLVDHASLVLTGGSSVQGNTAPGGRGGGLAAWDSVNMTLTGASRVEHNTAGHGGGLFATNRTVVSCTGCSIAHNTAKLAEACALLKRLAENFVEEHVFNGTEEETSYKVRFLHQPMVRGLTKDKPQCPCPSLDDVSCLRDMHAEGGGLCAVGNASVTLAAGSRVQGNVAVNGTGGGLYLAGYFNWIDKPSVTLTGDSSVHGNTAACGGGVYATSGSLTLTGGSNVQGNVADRDGGGLYVSKSSGNRFFAYAGGAVSEASVLITQGSSVHNNTAGSGGGGLSLSRASVVVVGGSSVHSNSAPTGGGMYMSDANVTLADGSSVHGNKALRGPGGGMHVVEASQVAIRNQSTVVNNTF